MTDWDISESLVIRTADGIDLDLQNLETKQLVLCAGGSVRSAIKEVWLWGSGVDYSGDAPLLGSMGGKHTVEGDYYTLSIRGGNVELNGSAGDVTLGENAAATLNCSCRSIRLGNMAQMTLNGSCDRLETGLLSKMTVTGSCDTVVMGMSSELTLGGDASTITMGDFSKLTASGNVKLIVMNYGCVLTLNGTADSIRMDKADSTAEGSGHAKLITIYDRGCTVTLSADEINNIWYDTYGRDFENALNEVKTMRVACTVEEDTFLCRNQDLTGYMVRLPKGATVYNEWHPTGDVFYVSYVDRDGKYWKGWTDRWACYIPDDTITTDGTLDYSDATKEGFVDGKGYDSDTEYLVWLSRYTQKVIVFQGSQGNWKVIKTMPCSSGENNTPTPEGVYEIYSRTRRWNFDLYYVDDVSIFSGGHAFHTILKDYGGGDYDDRVGIPLSHGCVRMLPEDCAYIYDLPMHTRVIVY